MREATYRRLGFKRGAGGPVSVANDGTAEITFFASQAGEPTYARIVKMSIFSTSALTGTCTVYVSEAGDTLPQHFDSQSLSGNADTWYSAGTEVLVFPDEELVLAWAGMTPGAQVWANLRYELLVEEVSIRDHTVGG